MELYEHQKKSLELTKNFNHVAYYLDMGLGKTFIGSEKLKDLDNDLNLIICQKSKIQDWIDHFVKYYQELFSTYDLTDKLQFKYFKENIGLKKKKIGVINYDLVFRRSYFQYLEDFTLLLDESSLIQNSKAKRTKYILKMKPKNVILLSGTPSSGKYENLWSQIHLLDWRISEDLYNKQYVNWRKENFGGTPFWYVDKKEPYKNVDRLKQKLREHGAIFMKTEECFDLPKQNNIFINIPVTKQYREFMKNSIVTLEDGEELVGDTGLTKRLYARELCGQYNEQKLEAFKNLLESTNDRLIVFYNYNEELKRLKEIAIKRPLSIINGSIKDLTAYEESDNSITLIQYQAGSMGLNLQKANKIVYFTLTDKSELFEQSKKRIHRIGQEKPCFYYIMICNHSVEEAVYNTLQKRKDFNDELFKEYERKEDLENGN